MFQRLLPLELKLIPCSPTFPARWHMLISEVDSWKTLSLLKHRSRFMNVTILYLIKQESYKNISYIIRPTEEHRVKVSSENFLYNCISLVYGKVMQGAEEHIQTSRSWYRVIDWQSYIHTFQKEIKVKVWRETKTYLF